MLTAVVPSVPDVPYRGIDAFRFQDHAIFFARERETQSLVRLISVYRGVLLYGESGCGKSSLINAGLLPEAIGLGFAPERVRVEPRSAGEVVIRRVRVAEGDDGLLPSALAPDGKGPRIVLSIEQLEHGLTDVCEHSRPLLIFDQFEEIVTRFVGPDAQEIQTDLLALIVRLLRGELPVKVLLSFREDYLGKIRALLSSCPELIDQALRITPPSPDSLHSMIRGPFEKYPQHFPHELTPALSEQLASQLQERFGAGEVSLSEMQTVCLRLWQAEDPDTLLKTRGLQGLLEDHLGEALDKMPARLRPVAVLLLSQMVTSAGTRNVISEEDLFQRVREQTGRRRRNAHGRVPDESLKDALQRLSRSRLVRSERHRDLQFYEITSEFLIPWIRNQRRKLNETRQRKRQFAYGALAGVSFLVAVAVTVLAVWALHQRSDAQHAAQAADSLALASDAQANSNRLDVSLLLSMLALAPYHAGPASPPAARSSMIDALLTTQLDGVVGILHRHTGPVNSVAFSRDGSRLASGNNDESVRLWSVATHRQVEWFPGQGGWIESVALSGADTLAAGDQNGLVRVWKVGHPHPISCWQGPAGQSVNSVAFDPRGQTIAAAYNTEKVHLVSLNASTSAKCSPASPWPADESISTEDGPVNAVAFSPDGKMIALANHDGAVTLWSTRTHGRLARFPAEKGAGPANSVAFSPRGVLAAAYQDGKVRVWNLRTDKLRYAPLIASTGPANSVAFSPTGNLLAAGGASGVLHVWNLAGAVPRGSELGALLEGPVYSVAFSPDGRMIASARGDGTVRLSRIGPTPLSTTLPVESRGVLDAVAVSQDGTLLAAAQPNRGVQLLNLHTRRPLGPVLPVPHPPMGTVAVGGGHRYVAASDSQDDVALWNTTTLKRTWLFASQSPVTTLAISQDGRLLAAGLKNEQIRIWNINSGRPLKPVDTHHEVNDLAFNPRGTMLASAHSDGTVRLWDIRAQQLRPHTLPHPLTGHTGVVYEVAFSPSGDTLASANSDGTTRLWSVAAGGQLASLPSNGPVFGVAYSPDGSMLASAGADRTVRLWDVRSQQQLGQTLQADHAAVESAAFGDGGQVIVSSDSTGAVRLYSGFLWNSYAQLKREVCGLVGTGLTPLEWTHYAPGIPYEKTCS